MQYEESNLSRLPSDPPVRLAAGKKVILKVALLLGTKMEIVIKWMSRNADSGWSQSLEAY